MKPLPCFVLLASYILFATHPAMANDFGARTYPFLPILVENQNPELCDAYLRAVKEEFLSTKVEMSLTDIPGVRWLEWKPVSQKPRTIEAEDRSYGQASHDSSELWRLDIDIDGSGKLRPIILRKSVESFRWVDTEHRVAYLLGSAADFAKWIDGSGPTSIYQYYPGSPITSQNPPYEVHLGGDHKWFEYKGKHYFLTADHLQSEFAGVSQLSSTGSRHLVCVARINPPQALFDRFTTWPGLKSYLKVLWTIGHASGGACGTLNSEGRHDMNAAASRRRAAIRPWATSSIWVIEGYGSTLYYNYDQRMLDFVKMWGYHDAWNHREYHTFLNHFQPAVKSLSAYYQREFGVPQDLAEQRAQLVFKELTGAHFLIPDGYESGSLDYHFGYNDPYARLHIRMLDGEPVNSLLSDLPTTKDAWKAFRIADAVEHPRLLKILIEQGADVNAPNTWDKTPLMVAAHLNRPDSVSLLLQAGADLHASTMSIYRCGLTIARGGRTALMYATENADVDVIRLLAWIIHDS